MKTPLLLSVVSAFCFLFSSAHAAIITDTISGWAESSSQDIGDGTNKVNAYWSYNAPNKGWFYGDDVTIQSDVAFATGVTDITQITDASIFAFTSESVGPLCDAQCDTDAVGDFVVWRNISSGYYGVIRIDDILGFVSNATLDATLWFQTDGTANFSSVPIPPSISLFGSGLLGLIRIARRKKSV